MNLPVGHAEKSDAGVSDGLGDGADVGGRGSVEDGVGRAQARRAENEVGPEGGPEPALREDDPLPHKNRPRPTRARTAPTFLSQGSLFSQ